MRSKWTVIAECVLRLVVAPAYLHSISCIYIYRFGTKGLAITFVSSPEDKAVLEKIQARFVVAVPPLPDQIDVSSYMAQ